MLTLQEVSSAACCSGNSWEGSALAVSSGLGVLLLSIRESLFSNQVEQISWGPTGVQAGRTQTFSNSFLFASILQDLMTLVLAVCADFGHASGGPVCRGLHFGSDFGSRSRTSSA